MTERVALIAGVSGVVGGNMAEMLVRAGEWEVIGLSRRPPDIGVPIQHISVDLLDEADCRLKLADLHRVTHVFYTALIDGRDIDDENARNTLMLENLMQAVVNAAPRLEHVHVLEGAKWYGYHLGPYKTPAREDDPPSGAPYFYHAQHDCVLRHQVGQRWTWSTTRPGAVCGYSSGSYINLMTVLAVYATMMKALDRPLTYPGTQEAYDALTFVTDVGLLNRAMLWASTTPGAANQAFNVANGDAFRWRDMWPKLTDFFDIKAGPVEPMKLTTFMADKDAVWSDLMRRHDLIQSDLQRLAPWGYADAVFSRGYDNLLSTVKANRFGFTEMIDTEEMFRRILGEFRARRVIP